MSSSFGVAQRGDTNPANFDEFMQRMVAAFPDAVVETDEDGQLVIHTNLKCDDDDVISEWEYVDDEQEVIDILAKFHDA